MTGRSLGWLTLAGALGLCCAGVRAERGDLTDQLQTGSQQIIMLDFSNALTTFRAAVAVAPASGAQAAEARFGLAVALQNLASVTPAQIAEAKQLYNDVIALAPASGWALRAMMNLGRIEDLGYNSQPARLLAARAWYEKARTAAAGGELAGEATLRIMGTYMQSYDAEQTRQGIAVGMAFMAQYPQHSYNAAIWEYIGDRQLWLKDYRACVDAYQKAIALGLVAADRPEGIYWRIARIAEVHLKDRELAVEFYTRHIVETPASGWAYESQLALRRLGAPVPEIKLRLAVTTQAATQPSATQPGGAP
jgi:tetratricopeptide (TPR) repeat protein